MTERQRKKKSDYIGFMFWVTVFCFIVMGALSRLEKPNRDPGYVQFPTDNEIQEIELGKR